MNKYLGLTIGPIIKTLSMARKPRELWSASYLFSYLMEMLIDAIPNKENILSPATGVTDKTVGLFPDRLFCKNSAGIDIFSNIINGVKNEFAVKLNVPQEYFNVYVVEINANSDNEAIELLNEKLDYLELYNVAYNNKDKEKDNSEIVRDLIFKKRESELFTIAFRKSEFEVESLAEISTKQLKQIPESKYDLCLADYKKSDNDSQFIKDLRKTLPNDFATPHKYICVVHADGDNIGKAVISINGEKLKELSQLLLNFGTKACKDIRDYQGMPIYAGGDDLLFISPVISGKKGKEQTFVDLIKTLDETFRKEVTGKFEWKDKDGKYLKEPSMSFGVSITYYKYPLYEALNISRELLFGKAKHVNGKNAIAWILQKNSGSAVSGQFSKTTDNHGEPEGIYKEFIALLNSISTSMDKNFVSAVPHKIKASETLLGLFAGADQTFNPDRLSAFFDHTLERKSKNEMEQEYLKVVETLLPALYHSLVKENNTKKPEEQKSKEDIIKDMVNNAYGILRTAKFIKGLEDDKDE